MNISLNITLMRSNELYLHGSAWQPLVGVLVGRGLDEEGVLPLGLSHALKGIICELRLETLLLSRFLKVTRSMTVILILDLGGIKSD